MYISSLISVIRFAMPVVEILKYTNRDFNHCMVSIGKLRRIPMWSNAAGTVSYSFIMTTARTSRSAVALRCADLHLSGCSVYVFLG